jgi:hypothetical protein
MIGYELEIPHLDDKIANLHLVKAMQKSVIKVESEIKPLTPVGVSGNMRASIGSQVSSNGLGAVVGKVSSSLKDYPAVMEFGRKPGRMPPVEALERWVQVKMRVPASELREVAFVVARSIARKGIKGRKFFERGFKASQSSILHYFAQALDDIAESLSIGT